MDIGELVSWVFILVICGLLAFVIIEGKVGNTVNSSKVYNRGKSLNFYQHSSDTSPEKFIAELRRIASFDFDTIEGTKSEKSVEDFSRLDTEDLLEILRNPIVGTDGKWQIVFKEGDKSEVRVTSDGKVEAEIDITDTWLQLTSSKVELHDVFRDKGKDVLVNIFSYTEDLPGTDDYSLSTGIFDDKTGGKYKYKLDIKNGSTEGERNIKLYVSYPKMAEDLVERLNADSYTTPKMAEEVVNYINESTNKITPASNSNCTCNTK